MINIRSRVKSVLDVHSQVRCTESLRKELELGSEISYLKAYRTPVVPSATEAVHDNTNLTSETTTLENAAPSNDITLANPPNNSSCRPHLSPHYPRARCALRSQRLTRLQWLTRCRVSTSASMSSATEWQSSQSNSILS
jgi:hypothetical protein